MVEHVFVLQHTYLNSEKVEIMWKKSKFQALVEWIAFFGQLSLALYGNQGYDLWLCFYFRGIIIYIELADLWTKPFSLL